MQKAHLVAASAVLALAGLAGIWWGGPPAESPPVEITRDGPMEVTEATVLTVHVAGAVRAPGLVTVRDGDRVAHAVAAAGGALPVANLALLNLAALVADGDRVVVPVQGETRHNPPALETGEQGPVDVNRASAVDLETLPGVGPVLARRILDYRENHGPFATIEDLLDVPGIGEGRLAGLREALIVR